MLSEPLPLLAESQGPASLDDPLYYLLNFRWLLEWVSTRYRDLLTEEELEFGQQFAALDQSSQGLFVRMVMRKGELFRADKLNYDELGPTHLAMAPLRQLGWVDAEPQLRLEELFSLFTWPELKKILNARLQALGLRRANKAQALQALAEQGLEPATPSQWGATVSCVYRFRQMTLCDRLRVMFFGNGHQDWSEFVLTELGRYQYEPVAFTDSSRPFQKRAEIDVYLQLQTCRQNFDTGTPLQQIIAAIPGLPSENPWLRRKRDKLVFKIARQLEREGELAEALTLYRDTDYSGTRLRQIRVLELQQEFDEALQLAEVALQAPESEAERQQVQRCLPRIRRQLGLPRLPKPVPIVTQHADLTLPYSCSVEQAVREHVESVDCPVFYVENCLFNSLFGLLCWEAIYAPIPGAFFHPFQRAPADLYWPDFYSRRIHLFKDCRAVLQSQRYCDIILENYAAKYGRQSPFVTWSVLSQDLLEMALTCIPARHLEIIFTRMLNDIKANSAGFPDLIQFFPEKGDYRLIEVKGPGDKLQDNQKRWLAAFTDAKIPAVVCYVQWQTDTVPPESGVVAR